MELPPSISKSPRWFIWLGTLLVVAPPAILFSIYGNREITGPITAFLPLNFFMSIGGIILIAYGLSKSRKMTDRISQAVDVALVREAAKLGEDRRRSWIGWILAVLFEGFFTWQFWTTGNSPSEVHGLRTISVIMFGILMVTTIATLLFRVRRSQLPWYYLFLDYRLRPRDEREEHILAQAGLQSMGAALVVITIVFFVLMLAPAPSILGLSFLAVTVVSAIRAVFSFAAWRGGIS